MGKTHDATRHLQGGGPTFDRITENLRTLHIPFNVSIRQNIHKDSNHETEELKNFVASLTKESGNTLVFSPAWVREYEAAPQHDQKIETLAQKKITAEINRYFRAITSPHK